MLRQYLIALVFVFSSFPSPALAQSEAAVEAAREHFNRAQIAYNEERWLDCAQHFEQSFQAIFAPELLYNIGICYERAAAVEGADRADDLSRALSAYMRYVRDLPDASDVVAVRVRIEDLRTLMDRARSEVGPVAEPVIDSPPAVEEVVPPTGDPDLTTDDVVVVHEDRGFGFTWTTAAGSLTLASFVTAIGLSVAAQQQFNNLAQGCGISSGCSDTDINSLASLAAAANAMYVVSGVLLAATGVSFGLEFYFWNSPSETQASLRYSTRF